MVSHAGLGRSWAGEEEHSRLRGGNISVRSCAGLDGTSALAAGAQRFCGRQSSAPPPSVCPSVCPNHCPCTLQTCCLHGKGIRKGGSFRIWRWEVIGFS